MKKLGIVLAVLMFQSLYAKCDVVDNSHEGITVITNTCDYYTVNHVTPMGRKYKLCLYSKVNNGKILNSMSFPYSDVRTSLKVQKGYLILDFTSLNLLNRRVIGRFDDGKPFRFHRVYLSDDNKALMIKLTKRLKRQLSKHKKLTVELKWFGQGSVYVQYNLKDLGEGCNNLKGF